MSSQLHSTTVPRSHPLHGVPVGRAERYILCANSTLQGSLRTWFSKVATDVLAGRNGKYEGEGLSFSFSLPPSLPPFLPSVYLSLLHKSLHSLGEVSHFSQGTKKEHLSIQEGSLRNTSGPVCLANGLGTVKRTLLCNLDQTSETGALVLFPSSLQAWQGHLLGGYHSPKPLTF